MHSSSPVRSGPGRWAAVAAALAVAAVAAHLTYPAPASAQSNQSNQSDQSDQGDPQAITWGVVPAGPAGPDGRNAFDYKLDPGAELVDQVAVSNHSTEEITVRVYASDAFTTADGGFDLLPAAEPPTDVGSWVTLDSPELTIPGRSRVLVPFELVVPENATPGDHAGGLVASLTSSGTGQDGDQVAIEHRVGARIYLRVTGELRPQLTVERIDAAYRGTWNPFAGGDLTATYTVRNTGNVRLTGQPRLVTAGWFGWGRRTADAEPLPEILPGDAFTATVRAGGVAPLVRLTTGVEVRPSAVGDGQRLDPPPPLTQRQVSVWAVPWGQTVLLALVAGAIAGWWWSRRRRRRRVAAQLAAAREQGRAEALTEKQLVGDA